MSRKDEILEAVISKFEDDGFSTNLTIAEIASKVDIGKSTIYEYFKTKDDVFKEALLKISNESIDEVLNIENIEELKFEEAFKNQFSKLLEVSQKSRVIYQIFSKDFIHRMPIGIKEELVCKMEDTKKVIEERFILIFVKGVQEGLIHIEADSANILVISSLVVGSIMRFSGDNQNIPLDEFVDKMYETVLKIAT